MNFEFLGVVLGGCEGSIRFRGEGGAGKELRSLYFILLEVVFFFKDLAFWVKLVVD